MGSSRTVSLRINVEHDSVGDATQSQDRMARSSGRLDDAQAKLSIELRRSKEETAAFALAQRSAAAASARTDARLAGIGRTTGRVSGTIAKATLALVGLNAAEAAARTLFNAGRDAIAAYAATNDDAAQMTSLLSDATERLRASFGEALLGGDNLEAVLGTVINAVSALTGHVDNNSEAMQHAARHGFADMLEALAAILEVGAVVINWGRALNMMWQTLEMTAQVLGASVVQLGIVMLQALLEPVQWISDGLASLTEQTALLARALGAGGLADSLIAGAYSLGELGDGVQDLQDGLWETHAAIRGGILVAIDEYGNEIDELTGAMYDTSAAASENAAAVRAQEDVVRDGSAAFEEYERTLRRVRDESDRVAESIDEATSSIQEFIREQQAGAAAGAGVAARGTLISQLIGSREEVERELTDMEEAASQILGSMQQAVGSAFSSMGQAIGNAFTGEGKKAGDVIKGILGQILVTVGTTATALAGLMVIPNPLTAVAFGTPAQGVALAAAGVVAVALGTAMGASSGGSSRSGGPDRALSGGGGGSTTNSSVTNVYRVSYGAGLPRRAMGRALVEGVGSAIEAGT